MKQLALFLSLFLITCSAWGQAGNVGIGTSTPAASSKLDINSTTQGILVPRMSTAQRTAISSPAKGLMAYDSTVNSFYYYNGSSWSAVGDNLGNHTATQNLSLGNQSGSSYQLVGGGGNHGLSVASDGHVEIGSVPAFPGASTSFQVDSGLTIKQISVPISSGIVTIPSNVSQVELTGTATYTVGVFAYPLNAGQQLTIWNHTSGGYGADVYGGGANPISTIPNGQMMTFRSVGTGSTTFLPEASSNNNVRSISSTSANMLGTDFFVRFSNNTTYNLSDPSGNSGRILYFWVTSSVLTVTLNCSSCTIWANGSPGSTSTISGHGKAMLISDGNDWIRMY